MKSRNGYGVVYNSKVVAEKGRESERLPTPPVPVKTGTYWLKEATYLGIVDRTGQPRADGEIDEAISAVETIMVKHATVLPLFTVHAGIIRDCLIELRVRRLRDESERSDMVTTDNKLKVYRDVWQRLYDEILNEKTSWGKEELKKRMDKMLIEEMEKYL